MGLSTFTFVNCGDLKSFLLLPDLKIWQNIAICDLNTVLKFYEKKNGRLLLISLFVKGAFYM